MIKMLLETLFHMLVVLPLILLTLKNKQRETLQVLAVFWAFFIANRLLLFLPIEFEELRPFQGNWNWAGKLYAFAGSILFLFAYRKFELRDYSLTLPRMKDSEKQDFG